MAGRRLPRVRDLRSPVRRRPQRRGDRAARRPEPGGGARTARDASRAIEARERRRLSGSRAISRRASARLYEHAEDERLRLRAVIDHAPAGILLFEPTAGRIVLANHAAEALLGTAVDHDLGTREHLERYAIHRHDGSRYAPGDLPAARALRGDTVVGEEILIGRTATRAGTPVLVNAAPVRDHGGRITGAVLAMHDIARIRQLERLREEFLSVIAHDLRTPIGVIENYTHVLERLAQSRAPAANELEAIASIGLSARRLGTMVADLLDASRIEANRLSLQRERVALPGFVAELVRRLEPLLGRHPVRTVVSDDVPAVSADPGRIEQVLTNLLTNAAKFSPDRTEIVVTIEGADREVVVSVHDRGPGIPPEERPRLFDRFYRARPGREHHDGLGLGLYIAHGLVESHGGRMWVDAAAGGGSAFRFTLPAADPATPAAA